MMSELSSITSIHNFSHGHREYLVCSYLRSGKISNWWQLCNLRSPAGSLRRLLVCSNAAVLSAAVLRKKERKYVDYYHSKS